jgi:hypothetical protein
LQRGSNPASRDAWWIMRTTVPYRRWCLMAMLTALAFAALLIYYLIILGKYEELEEEKNDYIWDDYMEYRQSERDRERMHRMVRDGSY